MRAILLQKYLGFIVKKKQLFLKKRERERGGRERERERGKGKERGGCLLWGCGWLGAR